MLGILRLLEIVKGAPAVEWTASRSLVEGHLRASEEIRGAWQLAGVRRDLDGAGNVVQEIPDLAVDVGATQPLSVQADDGTWLAGVVEYGVIAPRELGYTLRTSRGCESLQSLSERNALVRLVR